MTEIIEKMTAQFYEMRSIAMRNADIADASLADANKAYDTLKLCATAMLDAHGVMRPCAARTGLASAIHQACKTLGVKPLDRSQA